MIKMATTIMITISAFIKSMRGSDPDAAVYYLAKMLYAGEDVTFIARRIMICASEDVGNADPNALTVAVSAAQAVERLGMPEARIVLAQAVTYVASAPKSNAAYLAVDKATFRCSGVGEPHRFQRISAMPITKVLRSLGGASDINMPTIIRIIMWNSSICRMHTKI